MHRRFAARFPQGGDVLKTADRQTQIEFGQERLQEVGQALRAPVRQGVCIRAADPDGRRAQRQRDDHVRGIPHPGVEHHRVGAGGLDHPRQQLQGGDSRIRLTAAVVGAEEHVGTAVDGQPGVVGLLNALHRDGQAGLGPDPPQIPPGQRVGEDLDVVAQRGRLVFGRWLPA
jgi:hypothetical protein